MRRRIAWILVGLTIAVVLYPVVAEAGFRSRNGHVCHVSGLDGNVTKCGGSGIVVGSSFFTAFAHLAFHRADYWLGAPAPLFSSCGGKCT